MPNYRRPKLPGGTFFFTVVTCRRRKILTNPDCRDTMRNVIEHVRKKRPFTIESLVLLPDHLHCIWKLPKNDDEVSIRWNLIKSGFSKLMKPVYHKYEWMTDSKTSKRETTIWQRRYWEHQIRDDRDFEKHMDYIHYNPVKHGLANRVKDWPYSTFHRFVKEGIYPETWGGESTVELEQEFGEPKE